MQNVPMRSERSAVRINYFGSLESSLCTIQTWRTRTQNTQRAQGLFSWLLWVHFFCPVRWLYLPIARHFNLINYTKININKKRWWVRVHSNVICRLVFSASYALPRHLLPFPPLISAHTAIIQKWMERNKFYRLAWAEHISICPFRMRAIRGCGKQEMLSAH